MTVKSMPEGGVMQVSLLQVAIIEAGKFLI
jgi:hypothetical protein